MAIDTTKLGVEWGPATITRAAEIDGYTFINITTQAGQHITVSISPGGKNIRVFDQRSEWRPEQ